MANQVQLGNATVTRVVELTIEPGIAMFPHTPPQAWDDNAELMVPTFYDPATAKWRVAIQSWVIDVDGLRVLVDTGVGNGRHRPHLPVLSDLDTGYLDELEAARIDPKSVDVVINTHLHTDHVGWNTMRDGDRWVPTFPNARYLMPEADFRHFSPDGPGHEPGIQTVFDDSVLPVQEQTALWSGDHQISESLVLRTASGHTPGSSVLWLDAGKPTVFVGDITHCAIQIPRPSDPCAFDVDADAAAVTRKRIFTEATRRRATVIPAHYPGHGGASIVARGDRFQVERWLDIDPI